MGATFAYFTASVTGNENASSIIVKAAQIGTVTFEDGADIELTDALPGASKSKTFNIKADDNATIGIKYGILLKIQNNGFVNTASSESDDSDLVYTLKGTVQSANSSKGSAINEAEEGQENLTIKKSGNMYLGQGTLMPGEKHSYTFTIKFPENGSNQNSNQGKNFNGALEVTTKDESSSELYYNSSNPEGTTTQPTADGE